MLPLLIGIGVAIGVAGFARLTGFDRDRSFYSVVLTVVASYYVLFAVMAGATGQLLPEILFFALFVAAAVLGFRITQWIVVAGLVAHGVFDLVRGGFIAGSGVPAWWPAWCLGFDVGAGTLLALLMVSNRRTKAASAV